MDGIDILGFVAGVITTISWLPQLIKTWKTKKTEDLSLGMYSILFIGMSLWIIYGIILNSKPIIYANMISVSMVLTLLLLKIKYK
ncbi:MAG: SemiSWEET transporter [Nanoarchaeota archaeon]